MHPLERLSIQAKFRKGTQVNIVTSPEEFDVVILGGGTRCERSSAARARGRRQILEGSHLLLATGRTPNIQGIGLELAGVELTDRGNIKVNERLATTAPGVWAIGEVAGSPQFTHISVEDFRVVHDSITGGNRETTGRQIPFCLFTDPEFARIGLSEEAESIGRDGG